VIPGGMRKMLGTREDHGYNSTARRADHVEGHDEHGQGCLNADRRRSWLSEDLPNSQDRTRGIGRPTALPVTVFEKPANRCATRLLAFIVTPAYLPVPAHRVVRVRLSDRQCTVDYVGRPPPIYLRPRLLLFKADGSVSVHADDRAYSPLNWMTRRAGQPSSSKGRLELWVVENKAGEQLRITVEEIEHRLQPSARVDPGWSRRRRAASAGAPRRTRRAARRRVHVGAAGVHDRHRPVDLLCRDEVAARWRSRSSDAARSTESNSSLLPRAAQPRHCWRRSPNLCAQQIKPQARTLANDRGIRCVDFGLHQMRGMDSVEFPAVLALRLFHARRRNPLVGNARCRRWMRPAALRPDPTDTNTKYGRSRRRRATRSTAAPDVITNRHWHRRFGVMSAYSGCLRHDDRRPYHKCAVPMTIS